jgi:hypothetical protein
LGKDPREVQEEIDMFRLCTLTLGHRGQLVDDHPDAAAAVDFASRAASPSSVGLAEAADHSNAVHQPLSKKKGWIKLLKSDNRARTTVEAVQQLPLTEKRSLTQFHLREQIVTMFQHQVMLLDKKRHPSSPSPPPSPQQQQQQQQNQVGSRSAAAVPGAEEAATTSTRLPPPPLFPSGGSRSSSRAAQRIRSGATSTTSLHQQQSQEPSPRITYGLQVAESSVGEGAGDGLFLQGHAKAGSCVALYGGTVRLFPPQPSASE